MRNIIPLIFYGNLFYGLCALVLCLDTNLQHHLPANGPHFYFLTFTITVLYYSRIYFKIRVTNTDDKRIVWYSKHQNIILPSLIGLLILVFIDALVVILKFRNSAGNAPFIYWLLIILIPLVGFFYTYKKFPFPQVKQLRAIGWLKPFFIGFAWSGLITVYPVFFRQLQSGIAKQQFILPSGLYWLQNFLFISSLAIVFDIKDHAADLRYGLKTYPALLGVQKTLGMVVLPITFLSLGVLFLYQQQVQLSLTQSIIQTIPYVLLLTIIPFLTQKHSILFYLVFVDGLMLTKGLCGIISIYFF
ncbi:MAG: hypothetical protein LH478_08355 [Chitinophagaceae bacterium]|nr:hypothetical protein [Chitinophagaceae bacterium]